MSNNLHNKFKVIGVGEIDSPCPYDEFGRCGVRYSVESQQIINEIILLMKGGADKVEISGKLEVLKGRLYRRFLEKYGDAARAEREVEIDDKIMLIQAFLNK